MAKIAGGISPEYSHRAILKRIAGVGRWMYLSDEVLLLCLTLGGHLSVTLSHMIIRANPPIVEGTGVGRSVQSAPPPPTMFENVASIILCLRRT